MVCSSTKRVEKAQRVVFDGTHRLKDTYTDVTERFDLFRANDRGSTGQTRQKKEHGKHSWE